MTEEAAEAMAWSNTHHAVFRDWQEGGWGWLTVQDGACAMPRAKTNKEAEPESEGPYLLY